MTNLEKIRNMTAEEMTVFLMRWAMDFIMGKTPFNVKNWLESEEETE